MWAEASGYQLKGNPVAYRRPKAREGLRNKKPENLPPESEVNVEFPNSSFSCPDTVRYSDGLPET